MASGKPDWVKAAAGQQSAGILVLAMMDRLGAPIDAFGDSTGRIEELL